MWVLNAHFFPRVATQQATILLGWVSMLGGSGTHIAQQHTLIPCGLLPWHGQNWMHGRVWLQTLQGPQKIGKICLAKESSQLIRKD